MLVGVSTAGHDLASLGPLASVVPELKPVVAVADPVAVAADTGLLVAYGEGDAAPAATDAALAATGALGGVLRTGATLGARRTADGIVSTVRLTTAQRVARGAVQQARARRDALRASLRVPPARGTASSLVGGPAPRSMARGGARRRVHVPAMAGQLRSGARRAVNGVNTAARQRVDRAFLDDWRLATANGPQAQRMYAAGTTLEVTTKTLKPRAEGNGGGGNVR